MLDMQCSFQGLIHLPDWGRAVSRSTFPILIDEVNLSDEKNAWLVNALKSIIESRIARSKFTSSKA